MSADAQVTQPLLDRSQTPLCQDDMKKAMQLLEEDKALLAQKVQWRKERADLEANDMSSKTLKETTIMAAQAQRDYDTMIAEAKRDSTLVQGKMVVAGIRKSKFANAQDALDLNESWCTKKVNLCKKKSAQLAWLIVILGTELDLLGFVIAFFTYWNMFNSQGNAATNTTQFSKADEDAYNTVIHGFLVYGPCGYILAIKIYTEVENSDSGKAFCTKFTTFIKKYIPSTSTAVNAGAVAELVATTDPQTMARTLSTADTTTDAKKAGKDEKDSTGADTTTDAKKAGKDKKDDLLGSISDMASIAAKEAGEIRVVEFRDAEHLKTKVEPRYLRLHLYHFVPLVRSYILIKNMDPDDVEALFRVNGLSTFTLGVSQGVSMMLGFSKQKLKLDGLIWFGIVAQITNLFVTFLYFGTGLPSVLMNMSAIDTIANASREIMQAQFYRFENAIAQCAESTDSAASKKVIADLHLKLNEEIEARSNAGKSLPLTDLTYHEKMDILCGLRVKAANLFVTLKF